MFGVWLQALAVVLFFLAMVASVVAFGLHRRSAFATDSDTMTLGVNRERQTPAPLPRQAASAPVSHVNVNMPQALPLSTWWPMVVDGVHVMVVGETHSGKSTTAEALLAVRARTDDILIIDPHVEPKTWYGLPAVGVGRNYDEVDSMFLALDAEMTRRYNVRATGHPFGKPLTIFIDEYPSIAAECKNAAMAFKRLAREGRKVHMRLVVLTQDANVKTLGIEGEGPVRENLMKVLLGSFAAKVPGVGERPAALDRQGEVTAIDVADIPYMAQRAPSVRLWKPSQTEVQKLDAQETVFAASESAFGVSGLTFSPREIAKISAQIARGEKKTDVVTSMPGYASRHHSRFAGMYDELKSAIENN